MFVFAGVRAFLSRTLVWTNTDLFIFLGAGIPQVELVRDVTTDRGALGVEQRDPICSRRVEPIIRLAEHLCHEEFHSRRGGKRELIRVAGTDWTSGHRAHWRIENAVQI